MTTIILQCGCSIYIILQKRASLIMVIYIYAYVTFLLFIRFATISDNVRNKDVKDPFLNTSQCLRRSSIHVHTYIEDVIYRCIA